MSDASETERRIEALLFAVTRLSSTFSFILFDLFPRLPKKQVWADGGSQYCHDNGEVVSGVFKMRQNYADNRVAPRNARYEGRCDIGEE